MAGTQFSDIWGSVTARRKEIIPNRCVYARKLSDWVELHCTEAQSTSSLVVIAQTMLLLQKMYFQIRAITPLQHRNLNTTDADHICLFEVYEKEYEKLLDNELNLSPPQLFIPAAPPVLPPPPPPPEPKQELFNGLLLGEVFDDA